MISPEKTDTPIPGLYNITFKRFIDDRGYFSETSRVSDLPYIKNFKIVQTNESFNIKNVVRGLHFQWEPPMGKLVRSIYGTIYDILLDIRKESPTYGKAIITELVRDLKSESDMWVWAPPGIAHGFFCEDECMIEYMCSGEYSKPNEANISPLALDIDWSLADRGLVSKFNKVVKIAVITDKDRNGPSVAEWTADPRSSNFKYTL